MPDEVGDSIALQEHLSIAFLGLSRLDRDGSDGVLVEMEGDEIGNVDLGENVAVNHQKRIFLNAILGQFERASRAALGPLTKVVDGSAETLAMPDEPRTSPGRYAGSDAAPSSSTPKPSAIRFTKAK